MVNPEGSEVGGALSCCLPCAGGGAGTGTSSNAPRVLPTSSSGGIDKYLELHQHHYPHPYIIVQQHKKQQQQLRQYSSNVSSGVANEKELEGIKGAKVEVEKEEEERLPLGLDEYLGDLEEEEDDIGEEEIEDVVEHQDGAYETGGQHRLSPRLHDIEEEDDEECRNIRDRRYQKKSPTPSGGGGSTSRTGWRTRRSVTTAGPTVHCHHVIATAVATAQSKMQAEQGSIGELRGYHNLRSRRHTLANVRTRTLTN
ncbi:uncharacterized protein LOC106638271 [Copidosoma floridanum]|uniref:uncharacterized protein LOC106638271 n=1 Tax=Copidosoma floridanum TaxID=29053 RepID=UPI000C6FC088|nr:uncharacterized protein LOC106638271 [Copidosoma floridanum]